MKHSVLTADSTHNFTILNAATESMRKNLTEISSKAQDQLPIVNTSILTEN